MERDTCLHGIFTSLLIFHFIWKALRKEWPLWQEMPIPEPYFSYLLGSPVKEPSLYGVPSDRDAAFLEPSFIHRSKSPVYETPSWFQVPLGRKRPLWRETPVSRTFLNMSSRVPSKGALPRGPPQWASSELRGTVSGHRGRTATFSRQEYMPLFDGGKRPLIKMETALKNNYGFSNAGVKVLENFHMSSIYTTWKKKQEPLLSDFPLLQPCSIIKGTTVQKLHIYKQSEVNTNGI